MVTTKLEDVQGKVLVKYFEENSVFGEVSFKYLFNFFGWSGGGRLFEFELEWEGGGVGWALIPGWVLINFFCL